MATVFWSLYIVYMPVILFLVVIPIVLILVAVHLIKRKMELKKFYKSAEYFENVFDFIVGGVVAKQVILVKL